MTARELAVIIPVLIFIIWLGVYPKPFLDKTKASVEQLIRRVQFNEMIKWSADPVGDNTGTFIIDTSDKE